MKKDEIYEGSSERKDLKNAPHNGQENDWRNSCNIERKWKW